MIHKSTLIYDLETATFGNLGDIESHQLRVFGCYSYKTNKYYCLYTKKDIEDAIKNHKYVVGFNQLMYDNHVLSHNGFKEYTYTTKYGDAQLTGKINIDLMNIVVNRAAAMKISSGLLSDLLEQHSLNFITKLLGLVDENDGKKDLDYDLLNEDASLWSPEKKKLIEEYTIRDIEITKKLYEWLEDYFDCFKDFLHEKDIEDKVYLVSALSTYTYKAICKKLGVEDEFGTGEREEYGGGYVAYPAGEFFNGNIFCLDYNSLYPHIFAQCNLFSPAPTGWTGNGFFKVKGCYNDKVMGTIEKLLMEFYNMRLDLKKNNDPREYSVKIIINTSYGLTGHPAFKHLFNPVGAADCTRLGRQLVILARKYFRDAGFEILYTDTDSVYIRIDEGQKEYMLQVKDELIKKIKDNVPFPQSTFDMGIDDEISHMWFFKGKNKDSGEERGDFMSDDDDFINRHLGYMKKNYIYLTTNGKVKFKNLGVKKKSNSLLSRKIFKEYIIPNIQQNKVVKHPKSVYEKLIREMLDKNLDLATTRWSVNSEDSYKKPSQIQAQISKRYGKGLHKLIKNFKIGAGLGTKYCTLKEFTEHNMTIEDIDMSGVWNELQYFIEEEKQPSIDDWGF